MRVLSLLLALGLVWGCSCDDDDPATGTDGSVDGQLPDGSSGDDGSVSGDASQDGSTEDPNACGDDPCANHTGEKSFTAPETAATAPMTFAEATENAPGTNEAREPRIIYPSHETMFPINVTRIRFEWVAEGSDLYQLRFIGPNTTVSVYTNATNWTPSEEEWEWIAESNRGSKVTFEVTALSSADAGASFASQSIDLYFSQSQVEGALYYWSTGTAGVMKARLAEPDPFKFYTDPEGESAGKCVACHTLSRDGKRLSVGYEGENLAVVSAPDRDEYIPGDSGIRSAWTTFSPDGELILVAFDGVLTLYDSNTGIPVGPDEGVVPLPVGMEANHPDWNATGDTVALAVAESGGKKEIKQASIALLPYNDGAWGEPLVIVESTGGDDNNFFPSWSPDGKWIAYVNADEDSKDALTASLRLVSASGSVTHELTRLNQRVSNEDGIIDIGNSMPTWAPSSTPGIFWVAFSSLRAYATVREAHDKEDQIWIAAIDPSASGDLSYSAFWAPFQSIEEGNHRAFWTRDETDKLCSCVDECGDGLDNNCNGAADEASCVTCQDQEICGNGIDDDCDCVVDDCNVEICDNGIDDDGDDLIDGDDPACQIR